MKVSLSSWSYREWFDAGKIDLDALVDEAGRLNADGLEIFPRHLDADDFGGHLARVAERTRAAGLEIASLIAGNDFAAPDAADRAGQIETVKRRIAQAARAGVARMNIFTGDHRDGECPAAEVARVVDAFREVAPAAAAAGLVLCLENHSGVCRDADGLLGILQAVGSEKLRTNPDPSNFVAGFTRADEAARQAIYSETAKVAPYAANAHLKIGDFKDDGEHAYLDVGRIVNILRDAGYDGHVVLELYRADLDPSRTSAQGIALLRKHL